MEVKWEAVFIKNGEVKTVKETFEGDTLLCLHDRIQEYVNEQKIEGWDILVELVKDVFLK